MIRSKYVNLIVAIGMTIVVVLSLIFSISPESILVNAEQTHSIEKKYESTVFNKDELMTVDIQMSEKDWEAMLENAVSEEYAVCNVVVNGMSYKNVAIRPKGNTSLSQIIADDTTDRFSFKLEFDRYITGQTLEGLDKLILNNIMSDSTYMKEYLSYQLHEFLDIPSSLYSFCKITVNGEDWGIYLALEGVEKSFAERNFGYQYGQLYKPESSMLAGIGGGGEENKREMMNQIKENNFGNDTKPEEYIKNETNLEENTIEQNENTIENNSIKSNIKINNNTNDTIDNSKMNNKTIDDLEMDYSTNSNTNDNIINDTTGNEMPQNIQDIPTEQGDTDTQEQGNNRKSGMRMGGMKMNGFGSENANGADLAYIDDDISSYSTIFDNSIFNPSKKEKQKVIEALKHLEEGTELETYINVDECLRYIAVNTVLVNLDSYFGSMLHNYYLYEEDGRLSMIPWDYNLAFGGFQSNNASDAINLPIDTVVSGVSLEDRPLIAKLLEVEEYKEQYHEYLRIIVEDYFYSGLYQETIEKMDQLIGEEVKNDPTAFYTYEEYQTGLENLLQFGLLRAESIEGQLNGSIPSTEEAQAKDSSSLVDASGISMIAMGTQGGGNGGRGDGQGITPDNMQSNIQIIEQANQAFNDGADKNNMQNGEQPSFEKESEEIDSQQANAQVKENTKTEELEKEVFKEMPQQWQEGQEGFHMNKMGMLNMNYGIENIKENITILGISIVGLVIGTIFIICAKRRKYHL